MEKELAEVIEENGMIYRLAENGCYYPDVRLLEGTHYNIGKYGLMRWEYLMANRRSEYIRLLLDGKLNEYLHEVDEECHAMVELLVEQMKAGTGITAEENDICVMLNESRLPFVVFTEIYRFEGIMQKVSNNIPT